MYSPVHSLTSPFSFAIQLADVKSIAGITIIRMLPVLFVTVAAIAYAAYVEGAGAYALRNAIPMLLVIIISAVTLFRGAGQ